MSLSVSELSFVVIIGLILSTSVVCNVLVMVVVALNPQLRNPTNVLICNLAVSDLLLASMVLPQNLHDISHAEDSYFEGDFLCRVVYACPLLCIMASIYSMVAISFDRTYAILLNSNKNLTFRMAAIELAVIWVLSFIFCIPTMHEHSEFVIEQNENRTLLGCGSNGVSYAYSVINGVGLILLAYVIPLAVLLFNYGRILAFFRSKGMFGKEATDRRTVYQALFKTRMTVVKMLILIAVLFAISWAPYFALLLKEKPGDHPHAPLSPGTLRLVSIIKHMRQRIADEPERPITRIYSEVVSQTIGTNVDEADSLPTFQSIRSTLYRERKKQQSMPHEDRMTSDEQQSMPHEHHMTSDEQQSMPHEHQMTSDEQQSMPHEHQMTSDEHQTTSDDEDQVTSDGHKVTSDDEDQVPSDDCKVTSAEHHMTSDEQQTRSNEQRMASDENKTTCDDGVVIKMEPYEEDD